MAYAVGHISGGHFNPAVSFGLLAVGRFDAKEIVPYIAAQCVGAVAAAAALYTINGGAGDGSPGSFATNFYDSAVYFGKSYTMMQAFLTEFLLTMFFLIIILGATDRYANGKFAGIDIAKTLAAARVALFAASPHSSRLAALSPTLIPGFPLQSLTQTRFWINTQETKRLQPRISEWSILPKT